MIFGINTTRDVSKLSHDFTRLTAREITYNNFEISLKVFMPNITTNISCYYLYQSVKCPLLRTEQANQVHSAKFEKVEKNRDVVSRYGHSQTKNTPRGGSRVCGRIDSTIEL